MAAAALHPAHLLAFRFAGQLHRAFRALLDHGLVRLDVVDLDLAVHHEGGLVVGSGKPRGRPLGAQRLDDILQVLAYGDFLVGLGFRRDLEDIRERVVFRVVIDDLDGAFLIVFQRSEMRLLVAHLRVLHGACWDDCLRVGPSCIHGFCDQSPQPGTDRRSRAASTTRSPTSTGEAKMALTKRSKISRAATYAATLIVNVAA